MNENVFETLSYDEFDRPFTSINDVAEFILNRDNDSAMYTALRTLIHRYVRDNQPPYPWSGNAIGIIRALPIAQPLFETTQVGLAHQITAVKILNRAAAILRGES